MLLCVGKFLLRFLDPNQGLVESIHCSLTYSLHRTTTVKDNHIEDLSLLHCSLVFRSSILSDIFVLQSLFVYVYRVKQVTIPIIKYIKSLSPFDLYQIELRDTISLFGNSLLYLLIDDIYTILTPGDIQVHSPN